MEVAREAAGRSGASAESEGGSHEPPAAREDGLALIGGIVGSRQNGVAPNRWAVALKRSTSSSELIEDATRPSRERHAPAIAPQESPAAEYSRPPRRCTPPRPRKPWLLPLNRMPGPAAAAAARVAAKGCQRLAARARRLESRARVVPASLHLRPSHPQRACQQRHAQEAQSRDLKGEDGAPCRRQRATRRGVRALVGGRSH